MEATIRNQPLFEHGLLLRSHPRGDRVRGSPGTRGGRASRGPRREDIRSVCGIGGAAKIYCIRKPPAEGETRSRCAGSTYMYFAGQGAVGQRTKPLRGSAFGKPLQLPGWRVLRCW
jgi:hypothetical protein